MELDGTVLNGKKIEAIQDESTAEAPEHSGAMPLPSLVPKYVYICKQVVLDQALNSLSLKLHERKTLVVSDDEVVGFVCIDVPAHGVHPLLHKRSFFGDYKSTKKDALESVNTAALLYLQRSGIIFIDDVNSSELTDCQAQLYDCQRKLLAASNWASMFQEREESLQAKLTIANKENEKLLAAAKVFDVKQEASTPQTDHVKKEVLATPPFDNQTDASSSQCKKRRMFPNSNVRKSLFQINSSNGSKTQNGRSGKEKP